MASNEAFVIENQIADPKAGIGSGTLPCGYMSEGGELLTSIWVREITGSEEDMLASPKIKDHRKMGELISRCVMAIGPVTDRDELSRMVPKLLVGDRVYAFLLIRRVTLGDQYPFRSKCPECSVEGSFDVDLSALDVRVMPDPTVRQRTLKSPRGREFVIAPMDGVREERLHTFKNDNDKATLALASRVLLLDGKAPTIGDLKALPLSDRNLLRDAYQELEGGVDTTIDIECPECHAQFKNELSVTQRAFFFPSVAKKG
jgi:hypothetical protein